MQKGLSDEPKRIVVGRFLTNPDGEIRLVAEIDGIIVGGCLVVANCELRASYVHRRLLASLGSVLVQEIERMTRDHGLAYLQMDLSVAAEPFYLYRGYEVRQRGEHRLAPGRIVASIKIDKSLK